MLLDNITAKGIAAACMVCSERRHCYNIWVVARSVFSLHVGNLFLLMVP